MSYFSARELYTHRFSLNAIQLFDIFRRNDMKVISGKLINNNRFLKWVCWFINFNKKTQNFYERFLSGIHPVNQIEWIVRVGR